MKLEIDIDEDYYKIICKRVEDNKPYHSSYEYEVIANGKPLELEQEPTTKIEESNFSQEQYIADIQSAYDCGKSVIDKIRAEIIESCGYSKDYVGTFTFSTMSVQVVLSIIDKYKAETEAEDV